MKSKYCSPKNEKYRYSCLTNKSIKKLANNYNRYYSDKINVPYKIDKTNRKKIYEQLKDKINKKTNCSEEHCWLNSGNFRLFSDTEFKKSFRPPKPQEWNSDKNTWLSTTDIDNVLEQYMDKYIDFHYIGAVPIDFDSAHSLIPGSCVSNELCNIDLEKLYLAGIRKIGIVFNLDGHRQPGSHWVSMFADLNNGGIYYFDSYAKPPPNEVKDLMEKLRVMGNQLIYKNIIDINSLDDEHTTRIRFDKVDDSNAIISSSANFKRDTPTYLSNKTKVTKKNLFKIKNDKIIGGNGKNTLIKFDKNIGNGNKKKGILVQKGFKLFYNNIRFQYKGSECGVYSIHFQTELLKGKSFYQVIKNIINDDTINKQRDYYYRPTI